MRHSKLLHLYQFLSKAELRKFKKWIHSPLHNEHEGVQRLFAFINSQKRWTEENLSKAKAWAYVFPKKTYDDAHWRYIMALGLDVLMAFIGYIQGQQAPFERERDKIAYLLEHNAVELTKKPLEKATKALKNNAQNALFHHQSYQLEELKFELEGTQNRTRSTNIKSILHHATLSFFQTTLRYACIARSHQNLHKTDYKLDLLPMVLETIKKDWELYQQEPVLLLYYHGYCTLLGQEENFLALQAHWKNVDHLLAYQEKREMLLLVINYCIKQLNTGKSDYIRKGFEWYRLGLEKELLLEDGRLSLFAYSNMVALGLNLEEFDWVEQFLEHYTPYLPAVHQANYKHYNRAKLAFSKKDFATTMELLATVEYDDVLLNIGAKVLLLKIYYQEGYWDSLEALLDSFRIFLGRKKMLSYHKENYQNLITLTKRLAYLPTDKKATAQLREKIQQTTPLTERAWLLAQL
ncbi:MAG: hypothetical protein ACRBFS_09410 [Aureispira sp.]